MKLIFINFQKNVQFGMPYFNCHTDGIKSNVFITRLSYTQLGKHYPGSLSHPSSQRRQLTASILASLKLLLFYFSRAILV